MFRFALPALALGCLLLFVLPSVSTAQDSQHATTDPSASSLKHARETVKLLDNVYKQTIVLVTEKYVHDEDDFPAGSAAVELFRRISKGGSHHVRQIDVTGEPYEPENVAKTPFEKQAVQKLKAGKDYVEVVSEREGKPVLQAMTAVPVVMQKCVMCHSHYADVKPGAAIGGISFEVPLSE